jgi:hypothetical protein
MCYIRKTLIKKTYNYVKHNNFTKDGYAVHRTSQRGND